MDDYVVGYGNPPKEHQFQSGQSGNPDGRPKKTGTTELDLDDVLDREIVVQTANGEKKVDAREIELRQQVNKAKDGNVRSIKYVIEQFEKYGAITRPSSKILTGVVTLPVDKLPYGLSEMLFRYFGLPPWKKSQIDVFKDHYLETRSEHDAGVDERMGYDL